MAYAQERSEMRFPVQGMFGNLRAVGDVHVLNLSRSGIAFETPHKLTVGEDYFLEVRYREQVVNFGVNLRWCSLKRGSSRTGTRIYQAGGRFVDVLQETPGGLWARLLADPDETASRL